MRKLVGGLMEDYVSSQLSQNFYRCVKSGISSSQRPLLQTWKDVENGLKAIPKKIILIWSEDFWWWFNFHPGRINVSLKTAGKGFLFHLIGLWKRVKINNFHVWAKLPSLAAGHWPDEDNSFFQRRASIGIGFAWEGRGGVGRKKGIFGPIEANFIYVVQDRPILSPRSQQQGRKMAEIYHFQRKSSNGIGLWARVGWKERRKRGEGVEPRRGFQLKAILKQVFDHLLLRTYFVTMNIHD